MTYADLSRRIAHRFAATGGATVQPLTGREPSSGFAVSDPKYTWRLCIPSGPLPPCDVRRVVEAYTATHRDRWREGYFLGVWWDRDDGILWLDVTGVYASWDVADALARERGEKTIFDFNIRKVLDVEH